MMVTHKSADLFFQEGNSDKEYHIQIVEHSTDSYSVECQWGRVGSTLQTQTKVSGVVFAQAEKHYNKVYNEKVGKGYQDKTAKGKALGSGYVAPTVKGIILDSTTLKAPALPKSLPDASLIKLPCEVESGIVGLVNGRRKIRFEEEVVSLVPQLLNPISESELERYLRDEAYGAQEKKDGKHIMVRVAGGVVTAFNKKGKEVGYPSGWKSLKASCVLDGEAIGEVYHVFDLLEIAGDDLRGLGYGDRYKRLEQLGASVIKVVPLAIGYEAKKALYDKLVAGKREGIVFKRLSAVYVPGRPASGGSMVKFKFYAEASVRVAAGREGKHSIGMEVLEDGVGWVFVGNCTVGQKTALPAVGTVAEIRYLYAYKGGSLYQPSYKEPRDDVDVGECVIGQLKYKSTEETE